MPREHSSYRGVLIYDGSIGEKPIPGAFYQTTAGDILAGSKSVSIGFKAYGKDGLWRLINDHQWNIQNVRRYTDNSCRSPAPLGTRQGNIVICKRDGSFPILWIPPLTGEGPDAVKPAHPTVPPSQPVMPNVPTETTPVPASIMPPASPVQNTGKKPTIIWLVGFGLMALGVIFGASVLKKRRR